jgi:hypothetical protein
LFKYSGAFTLKGLLQHWLVFTLHLPAKKESFRPLCVYVTWPSENCCSFDDPQLAVIIYVQAATGL